MITRILELVTLGIEGAPLVALIAALGWGIISVLLSPCHLASIPLIIGFISNQGKSSVRRAFGLSLVFALGILITIAGIGLITAALGRMLGDVGIWGNYFVAVIFFVIGLYFLEVINFSWNSHQLQAVTQKGYWAALVMGLVFGIALGPCTFAYMAPMLGVAFRVAATNLLFSISLMLVFGIGHCAVIVLAGTLAQKVQQYLNWTEQSKTTKMLRKVCGVLIILGGCYLIYKTLV